MDKREWLAERFGEHRTRLRAVAYRMLGSLSKADDAVQEAWLRLNRTDASGLENLGAWLMIVVARISPKGGDRTIERLLSVDQTCRLQRRSLYAYLSAALTAKARGDPAPTLA